MLEGTISAVVCGRGFGFIEAPNMPRLFFHETALADGLEFDERLQERRVRFDLGRTNKGPAAVNVRPID